jgi:hypothetical protein
MIRLLKILVVLGLAWSAYWYGSGYLVRKGVAGWFNQRAALGWQADFADITTSGFPLRHATTLTSPALADPANGTAWQADWLIMDNPAIWPGKQTLLFPPTVQRLSYLDQTVELRAADMVADFHLAPGTALEVQRMALTTGPWVISAEAADILGGQALTVSMQETEQPATYQFNISVPQFTPDESLRQPNSAAAALPSTFETLALDMTVGFDRPWDRRALEERRPQPRTIDLRLAQAAWGALSLFAAGQLTVDDNAVPTGTVTLKAENWRDMLAIARQSGVIPEIAEEPTAKILNLLSRVSGNPDTLDVELTLRDGMMFMGILPLGPAPYIYLR